NRQRDVHVRVVVLVHAGVEDSGYLEPHRQWDRLAGQRVDFALPETDERDRISDESVQSSRDELPQRDPATSAVGTREAKVTDRSATANIGPLRCVSRLWRQPNDVPALHVGMAGVDEALSHDKWPCGHHTRLSLHLPQNRL